MFDILPLHGTLLPGESQQVQFTFYGHTDLATECMAVCKVEGGPAYQIRLIGEASLVQYRFSSKYIDFGKQVPAQILCTVHTTIHSYNIVHLYIFHTYYVHNTCTQYMIHTYYVHNTCTQYMIHTYYVHNTCTQYMIHTYYVHNT